MHGEVLQGLRESSDSNVKLMLDYTKLKDAADEMEKQIMLYYEADGSITIEALLQSAINYKHLTNKP